MGYEQSITMLERGVVLAECGPMRISISAMVGRVPQPQVCERAAKVAFGLLERVARLQGILRTPVRGIRGRPEDAVAGRMVESVLAVGDADLTPMAAVAGTIADAVADFLISWGMTRVVVDNGGDLAVRLLGDSRVRVGIRPQVTEPSISHVLFLDAVRPSWGVATSGLGGRSFTRGVASAATVLAADASIADAAATSIANASHVEDEAVVQKPAGLIDPDTDIPELAVTVKAGPLSEEKKKLAMGQALGKAEALVRKDLIIGAFIAIGKQFVMTDSLREVLVETVEPPAGISNPSTRCVEVGAGKIKVP